ncbi:MAG: glycosyltransferase [Dysgonamonadaceae bacterium]|jgi:glycosyltransferase involved in cell wall biosynthesis/2-polyprenyl-3-methyl-5-hydroxy-6-metoxy-1,4-benzoquinol methylase|nr:glycosyltransferase [Dysgonamonadaceae bacterium]
MRITVSVTNDLVTDQRVHKVCTTLARNGYEVKLVGRKFRNSLLLERIYQTDRLRLLFNRSALFYVEYNIRLFFYLLFDKTDLFLSNDTDSLPANYLASKIRRKPLVFDAHEMFPEVPEVTDRKFVKRVWTKLEDWMFPHLKHCYTVCQSIADYYNLRYKINMEVVRNIPPACEHEDAIVFSHSQKIILYQGAVNIGRGIEWVIDAMPYLDDFVFYVVGDGDILQQLKERVNRMKLNEKVIFTGRVPFEALPAYTACADIGVNLLENKGLNYYYSLPNRIFDYMRMHVPILTSDFPEIRRIVGHYGIGTLVNHYEPQFLAETIKQMFAQGKNEAGFAAANAGLSWENESEILLQVIRKALKVPEKEMEKTAESCIAKIREIDFNRLDISDYNRKYIQNILLYIHYYFKIYTQAVSTFSNSQPEKNWVVDFGGGHGFLSLFLKSIGYRVIYCDINPLSVKTVSKIKAETGFGPDEIIAGSVTELNRFCLDNQLKPDYLIATDLIEHVYDLQDFFRQLQSINPDFEMVFTTASNPENAYKCRQLRRFMVQAEEGYFHKRKELIQTNANRLTETETTVLAKLSRGKIYPDILKMLDAYHQTGKLPSPPDDAFNTCDPETGNWTERIVPLKTYEQFASEAGFRTAFAPGFYNEERGSKIISFVCRTLNFCIKQSGKSGFKFAPYLLIKLSPKHG